MQVRCYSCHTPFSLNRETIHAALDEMTSKGHSHYNAHCPRCGKANKVSKKQLRRWAPAWAPPARPKEKEKGKKQDEKAAKDKKK